MSDKKECVTCGESFARVAGHYRSFQDHAPDDWMACYDCGNMYGQLGAHWSRSNTCGYPELTDHQHSVITGMLMSDSWINTGGNNGWKANLETEMTIEPYLQYINEEVFPNIGTSVSLLRTAEEVCERSQRNTTVDGSENAEDYSDMYAWRTVGHPELSDYRSWYDSGEKQWPDGLELSPVAFKHLFVGDGSYHQGDEYIKITTVNEMDNEEKVVSIFDRSGIRINNFRYDPHSDKVDIFLSKSESERMFELMGDPLPGFEYKWPESYR